MSGGVGKTAVAFLVGAGLALGGAMLYTHFASPAKDVQVEASVPAVPDSVQKLPDDDLTASMAVRPEAKPEAVRPEAKPEAVRPQAKTAQVTATKPRVQSTHVAARHTVPAREKVNRRSEPPRLLAENSPPQAASPPANPYTVPLAPAEMQPAPQNQPESPAVPVPEIQPGQFPAVQAAPREPRTVTIPAGTALNIRVNQILSSDHNFVGDTFQGTLESSVTMDNALIAERGSKVIGKVTNVQRGTHDSGSDLSIALTFINTTDGQRVPVQTSIYDQQTTRNSGKDAAKVGGGAALGAIIGAIAGGGKGAAIGAGVGGAAGGGDVLFSHGRPAVVQSETRIAFRLSAPVTITEHINQ